MLIRQVLSEPGRARCWWSTSGSLHTSLARRRGRRAGPGNGCAGVVINGAVRGDRCLGGLDIGVKALGSNPCKSGQGRRRRGRRPVSSAACASTRRAHLLRRGRHRGGHRCLKVTSGGSPARRAGAGLAGPDPGRAGAHPGGDLPGPAGHLLPGPGPGGGRDRDRAHHRRLRRDPAGGGRAAGPGGRPPPPGGHVRRRGRDPGPPPSCCSGLAGSWPRSPSGAPCSASATWP